MNIEEYYIGMAADLMPEGYQIMKRQKDVREALDTTNYGDINKDITKEDAFIYASERLQENADVPAIIEKKKDLNRALRYLRENDKVFMIKTGGKNKQSRRQYIIQYFEENFLKEGFVYYRTLIYIYLGGKIRWEDKGYKSGSGRTAKMYKDDITSRGYGSMSGYGKGERSKKRFLLDKNAPTPEELAEIALRDAPHATQEFYDNNLGLALTEVLEAFNDVNSTADAFAILESVYNQHNKKEKKDFDVADLDTTDYYNDNGYFVENEPYNDNGFVTF